MAESQETRDLRMEHLFTDIRYAMNTRRFDVAQRLSIQLAAELGNDDALRAMFYPVCLGCNGYAEIVDPKQPERMTMCASASDACVGNKGGRMSPDQFQAYLDANLSPVKPTRTEVVPKADETGNVPRLPHDGMKPTEPPVKMRQDGESDAEIDAREYPPAQL